MQERPGPLPATRFRDSLEPGMGAIFDHAKMEV